jgi:hypothetical protein
MNLRNPLLALVCMLFLAIIPAYCQNGDISLNIAATSDKFGDLARTTAAEAILDGQFAAYHTQDKEHGPVIMVGGEVRYPFDTTNHSTEFALFGGPMFRLNSSFSFGVHAQFRETYLPSSIISGIEFNRYNMRLFELPILAEYKFGTDKRAFVQAQAMPEFTPHFKNPSSGPPPYPHPNFDHGYTLRAVAGYNFGKWYAKAMYETRYFKFEPTYPNPDGLYNWRTDMVSGGVGLTF